MVRPCCSRSGAQLRSRGPSKRTTVTRDTCFATMGPSADGRRIPECGRVGAHEKPPFQTGIELSGCAVPVEDPRKENGGRSTNDQLKVVKDAEVNPRPVHDFRCAP